MIWLLFVAVTLLLLWAVAKFHLSGPDLGRFDSPRDQQVPGHSAPSPQHHEVVASLRRMFGEMMTNTRRRERLPAIRRQLDQISASVDTTGVTIVAANADGVPGEWVKAEGADPDRRFLYIHGGAFTMGSPRSHRGITTKFARMTGASVFAVDYRLMPENPRRTGITDCQTAYRWILENGPDGRAPARTLFVGGDSAGGNLTLMLLAWARDRGLRAADAAVVLSPGTDATLSSPSIRRNVATDPMLGPGFGSLARIPRTVVLFFTWIGNRMNPRDPLLSPVFGDLSNLPPTLVHASEAEMLVDDARRYVNKARAAGSPVTLETWPYMVHVWHMFESQLPEAKEAFERIGAFLERCAPAGASRRLGTA